MRRSVSLFWSKNRPLETIQRAVAYSIYCFALPRYSFLTCLLASSSALVPFGDTAHLHNVTVVDGLQGYVSILYTGCKRTAGGRRVCGALLCQLCLVRAAR